MSKGPVCTLTKRTRLAKLMLLAVELTETELANNLGKRSAKARFYREFERMKPLRKAYIVCEFPESKVYEFPKDSGMSQFQLAKVRINGKYIMRLVNNIKEDFQNIEIVFCEDRDSAETFTYNTLKSWEQEIQ